mgnify:FL=1
MRANEIFTEGPLSTKTFSEKSYSGDRWTNFLARLDRSDGKGGKFELTPKVGGGTVTIDHVPEIVRDLKLPEPQWPRGRKKNGEQSNTIAFPINGTWEKRIENEDGTTDYSNVQFVPLGSLEKTNAFGSTGGEAQVADETQKLNILNTILLEKLEEAGKKEIPIIIGDRKVNVAGFISTPKNPNCGGDCKADWTAIDSNRNEVAWISHKKYKENSKEDYSHAADFFGWGGMSDSLMTPIYDKHPAIKEEIYKFASDVKKAYSGDEGEEYYTTYNRDGDIRISSLPKIGKDGEIDPNGTGLWVYRKITNGLIRAFSVYGVGFGGTRGVQNVDLVIQGVPSFTNDTIPKLIATTGTHSNGDKPDRAEGGYEPVLVAKYNPSRNDFSKQFSFRGVRFSIFPIAAITQRKGAKVGTIREIK